MSRKSNWQVLNPKVKPDSDLLIDSFKEAFDGNIMMYTKYFDIETFIEKHQDVLTEDEIKKLKQ